MFAESIVVAGSFAVLVAQQSAQKYADGQDVRICGEVVAAHANPSTCETTLRVKAAGEELFYVFIPASLEKEMKQRPQRLHAAEGCFTGKVALVSGAVRIIATAAEITTMPPAPPLEEGVVLPCGEMVTLPQVLKEKKPQYTAVTMKAGISGTVDVEAVVLPDGSVGTVRVVKPLHPELDEQAVSAVREWKFVPGAKNGRPVPVLVHIELTFTTRSRKE